MLFGGVDIGHQTISVVLMDENGTVIDSISETNSNNAEKGSTEVIENILCKNNYKIDDLDYLVATGVGREQCLLAGKTVTSPQCHAMGARYSCPEVQGVIDIGADGFRIVSMNKQGMIMRIAENGRCASGSGIFFEEMAAALGISLEEACQEGLKAHRVEPISSLCAVFAESEVVSAIHREIPREEIVAGIHMSIVDMVVSKAKTILPAGDIAVTGGLAQNPCLIKMLNEKLKGNVVTPKAPRACGALGAAIYAKQIGRCD